MKTAFTSLGIMVLLLASYLTIDYLATSRVEQEVSENKHDAHKMMLSELSFDFYMPLYSMVGDSTQIREREQRVKADSIRRELLHKEFEAPYVLTTKYKDITIIDYGTFREIDSLKCIRYNEMLARKIAIDSILTAKQNAIERTKTELKSLNKSCN